VIIVAAFNLSVPAHKSAERQAQIILRGHGADVHVDVKRVDEATKVGEIEVSLLAMSSSPVPRTTYVGRPPLRSVQFHFTPKDEGRIYARGLDTNKPLPAGDYLVWVVARGLDCSVEVWDEAPKPPESD